MPENLINWPPRNRPARAPILGRYVDLVPLDVAAHAEGLFSAASVRDADEKFRWLPEAPPQDLTAVTAWAEKASQSTDPLFFAVLDKATGKVAGRQALMRIDTSNGVIEIGNIYWGPLIARQRGATEALFLFMHQAFDVLGYRRFEWKCNNDNVPSKIAAERFGFTAEGVFRQHMIVKGLTRDTAWFSIIDKEWPGLRVAYVGWLDPANFDAAGHQRRKLQSFYQR